MPSDEFNTDKVRVGGTQGGNQGELEISNFNFPLNGADPF